MNVVHNIEDINSSRGPADAESFIEQCIFDAQFSEYAEREELDRLFQKWQRCVEEPSGPSCAADDKPSENSVGALGFLLVSCLLHAIETDVSPDQANTSTLRTRITSILAVESVSDYIGRLYQFPGDKTPLLSGMVFHRLGTTSWIFTTRSRALAIKLVRPWFFSVPAIGQNAASYKDKIDPLFKDPSLDAQRYTAKVLCCSPRYVVMDFIEGDTLYDWLRVKRQSFAEGKFDEQSEQYSEYFGELVGYFRQLCLALAQCSAVGLRHLDLNPTNVIISPRISVDDGKGDFEIKVVDFGINYLVTHRVGLGGQFRRIEHYVSPEVLAGSRVADERSDWYSLGRILLDAVSLREVQEDVETSIFRVRQVYSGLGDLLDSLLVRKPEFRLCEPALQMGLMTEHVRIYRKLAETVETEVVVFASIASARAWRRVSKPFAFVVDLLTPPVAGRLYEMLRTQMASRTKERKRDAAVNAIPVTLTHLCLIVIAISAMRILISDRFRFPWIIPYPTEMTDPVPTYPALFAGVSFGVIAFVYYLQIYATLSVRELPKLVGLCVHANSFVFTIPILYAFVHPQAWAICSAVGMIFITANNRVTFVVALRGTRSYSRKVGTPPPPILLEVLRSYWPWWVGTSVYGSLLLLVGLALEPGFSLWHRLGFPMVLHDRLFYVVGMVSMNFWLLIYNCGAESARIRAMLESSFHRYRVASRCGG